VFPELKKGSLFPFVQSQERCEISIFHPEVYPAYRKPLSPEEIALLEAEEEEARRAEEEAEAAN